MGNENIRNSAPILSESSYPKDGPKSRRKLILAFENIEQIYSICTALRGLLFKAWDDKEFPYKVTIEVEQGLDPHIEWLLKNKEYKVSLDGKKCKKMANESDVEAQASEASKER